MAKSDSNSATPSIFERLTDRNPSAPHSDSRSPWVSVSEVEASVIQHLVALLNVRRCDHAQDSDFPETASSVAAYGILDFSSLSLMSPSDREKLRRSIDRAIRLFEPRLTRVQVVLEEWKSTDPGLRFRIEATLRTESVVEPVVFSAMLAKDSGRFDVAEGRR